MNHVRKKPANANRHKGFCKFYHRWDIKEDDMFKTFFWAEIRFQLCENDFYIFSLTVPQYELRTVTISWIAAENIMEVFNYTAFLSDSLLQTACQQIILKPFRANDIKRTLISWLITFAHKLSFRM